MNYIKQDLIEEIAIANNITRIQASIYVETVLEGLVKVVSKMKPNDNFKLGGYLHINVKELGERGGVHPLTQAPIIKPKKKVVRAKLGTKFTEALK